MRLLASRGSCAAVLLLGAVAGATAQPPSNSNVEKLKAGAAALAADQAGARPAGDDRAKLMGELKDLLKEFDKLPQRPTPPPPPPPPDPNKGAGPKLTPVPVDRLREAINLVYSNQIDSALNAFRHLPEQDLDKEDRAFVRFMIASCYRRLGLTTKAMDAYRLLGSDAEDQFVASSARSQLYLLSSALEYKAELAKLREGPKSR